MNEEFTIVQLKNRIKELEQQVSLYEKIIDFVPISIFAKDVQNEYRYLVWNKQLEKVFGTKKKDIIGTHDYDLFENKTDADYFRNYDMEVMKGKQIVDIPQEDLRTVEGIKIVHTRKIPIYDDNGNPQILLGCLEDITERIETEQALIASEFKYKQLFENLTVPFALHEIICDEKGKPIDYRYLEANPEFIFRTGLSPENLINKRGLEIFPTTEWSWIEHYGQVALTGETLKFENYSYELDKYYEAVAFSPQPKQFAVLFNDITMHKRVEKEISDAKMFYSDLVETAQDLIWKCNDKGQFTFLNNACEKIYGYKINEMLGRPFTDFMEEETARRDKVIFKKLLFETGIISGYETTHIKKDGNPVYLSFNAKKYEDKVGNFFGAQGTAHDLTNRKKIEKALKVSEEQFRKLLEMLPVAVAIHCEGMLKYVNNNVLQILKGESKDDFFEKPAIELVHPESRNIALQRIHEAIVKQQIAPLYEEKFITLEGEPVDVEVTSLPTLFDLKPAMLVVFQDISKRKQHEQTLIEHEELLKHQNEEYETLNEELTELNNQLSKAKEKAEESDRLKSAFLANMSHEIRTPMNGIIGFADLINEPDIDNEKRKSYSEIIKNSCFQLLNIVNDIIDISKIETGQIEIKENIINVNNLIHELYSFYKPVLIKNNINFYVQKTLNDETGLINTDEVKLKQILNNLISNAVKFTQKGFIQFGYTQKGDFLEFFVEDTGIGIFEDQHHLIFDRFQQAKMQNSNNYGGTGLGLAIAKAYIEKLGGEIWLNSSLENGSTFYFTVPYKPVITRNKETMNSINPYFNVNIKILVVEDEEINFMYIDEVLKKMNIKVLHAKNGQESLLLLEQNSDIDLILMDIKLPDINGYDLTIKIKQLNSNIPIIAQTAYAMSGDKERALNAGCIDYISKPIIKSKLIEIIKKQVKF